MASILSAQARFNESAAISLSLSPRELIGSNLPLLLLSVPLAPFSTDAPTSPSRSEHATLSLASAARMEWLFNWIMLFLSLELNLAAVARRVVCVCVTIESRMGRVSERGRGFHTHTHTQKRACVMCVCIFHDGGDAC